MGVVKRLLGRLLVVGFVVVGVNSSLHANDYAALIKGINVVEQNSLYLGISKEELAALKNTQKYQEIIQNNLLLEEDISSLIDAIKSQKLSIGDVELSELLMQTELYNRKTALFDNTFIAVNKVISKIPIYEGNIQIKYDNLNINEKLSEMNKYNSSSITLFQSMVNQKNLLLNSSKIAWSTARGTFLRIPFEGQLVQIVNSANATKEIIFVVQSIEDILAIIQIIINKDSSPKAVLDSMGKASKLIKELNSKVGTASDILTAALMIPELFEQKKYINSINLTKLSNSSKDFIQKYNENLDNELILALSNLLAKTFKLLDRSGFDTTGVANNFATFLNQTKSVETINEVRITNEKVKELNKKIDNIIIDSKIVLDAFYIELGRELAQKPELENKIIHAYSSQEGVYKIPQSIYFSDLSEENIYYPYIKMLAYKNAINLTRPLFNPGDSITQFEFLVILNKLFFKNEFSSYLSKQSNKKDQSHYFAFRETSLSVINKDKAITRGEVADALYSVFQEQFDLQEPVGTDKLITWYIKRIESYSSKIEKDWTFTSTFLKATGISDTYTDGFYRPQNTITRGEVSKLLINAYNLLEANK